MVITGQHISDNEGDKSEYSRHLDYYNTLNLIYGIPGRIYKIREVQIISNTIIFNHSTW